MKLNPAGPAITTNANSTVSGPPVEVVAPPPESYPEKNKMPATDAQFEFARFNYMKNYDFAAMSAWLEKYDSPAADEDKLDQICVPMRELFDWCHIQLQNYSAQKPLVVHSDRDDQDYEFGRSLRRRHVQIKKGHADATQGPVPPWAMTGIAAQLIRQNATPNTPATVLLWRGLKFFVETYQVKISPPVAKGTG